MYARARVWSKVKVKVSLCYTHNVMHIVIVLGKVPRLLSKSLHFHYKAHEMASHVCVVNVQSIYVVSLGPKADEANMKCNQHEGCCASVYS